MTGHVFLISKPPLTGLKATTLKQSNTVHLRREVHKREIVHGRSIDLVVLLPFCMGVSFLPSPPQKTPYRRLSMVGKLMFLASFSQHCLVQITHSLLTSSCIELNEI